MDGVSANSAAEAPRVVIVGAGFAGLECARALRREPVHITVVDANNHHCFQPLLYQVATAALAPNDVAWPVRGLLARQSNTSVLMATAEGVDIARKILRTNRGELRYDYLVLATGASHSYFGREDWAKHAPGLKTIEDATVIRERLLLAFEEAEATGDKSEAQRLLTFIVVGGGPTGVELAGAIAEMARQTLANDFRRIDPRLARVLLLEAGPRLLNAYPEGLARYAARALQRRGVDVELNTQVLDIDAKGVTSSKGRIDAGVALWAAGVTASPAGRWLDAETDRAGRVKASPSLTLTGHDELYVVGDTAAVMHDGVPVPGIAPAAKQMGRYVAERIQSQLNRRPFPRPFRYFHQGDLATIGRNAAIVRLRGLELRAFAGWLFWSIAHIYFLIGARNRIAVAFNWLWDYVTLQRSARLILRQTALSQTSAPAALRDALLPPAIAPNEPGQSIH